MHDNTRIGSFIDMMENKSILDILVLRSFHFGCSKQLYST